MNDLFICGINIDWGKIEKNSYLRDIPALSKIDELVFDNRITFFVGENGSGKSTLLEAIAVRYGFNAEGGSKNYNFSTYDSHSGLSDAIFITKGPYHPQSNYFLRSESFYNVASKAEEYRDDDAPETFYSRSGGKSFHDQSHGESFLALIQGNFEENGIYILDEPESALSPQRQLVLLREMHMLASLGAQFIIATHSPILLSIPDATILNFTEDGISPCEYTETDSYKITELFIKNRESIIKKLFDEE